MKSIIIEVKNYSQVNKEINDVLRTAKEHIELIFVVRRKLNKNIKKLIREISSIIPTTIEIEERNDYRIKEL